MNLIKMLAFVINGQQLEVHLNLHAPLNLHKQHVKN